MDYTALVSQDRTMYPSHVRSSMLARTHDSLMQFSISYIYHQHIEHSQS